MYHFYDGIDSTTEVLYMSQNNLKKLRKEHNLTQKEIAKIINCNRSTYNNYERGIIIIPLDIADKLSIYYQVRLSYICALDQEYQKKENFKPINYEKLLENLNNLKKQYKHTYKEIAININCTESTVQRYFTNVFLPPLDRLIQLAQLYNIDLDVLCAKENFSH